MLPFKVHILGCGSALPTGRHNPSAQVVELRNKFFLVDCGEGCQLQLRRSRIGFSKINNVFISHLHGDHSFGLIGLISTMGMLGRMAQLNIYATPALWPILCVQLETFCHGLEYKVEFHPVDTSTVSVIYEDNSLTVETIPLDHRVPCCGFLFREKPTLPHIKRSMIDFYNIPVSQINNIKNGMGWVTEDGEEIPNSRLVAPADPPRSYAYCSDTKYIPGLGRSLEGVSTIYHESTYCEEDAIRAEKYFHSTASQAAMVARAAKAKQLIIGHYSARYDTEDTLLKEARKVFANTVAANEMKTFNV